VSLLAADLYGLFVPQNMSDPTTEMKGIFEKLWDLVGWILLAGIFRFVMGWHGFVNWPWRK
jgi:hypothetical protein